MRYFNFIEPGDDGEAVHQVVSEEEIRQTYYPIWYKNVCKKYGKEYTDATYSFEECLDDWCGIHGAWQ